MEEKEKMMLNSQCKEDFEKWYSNEYVSKPNVYNNCFDLISGENILEPFYKLPLSMQYGCYVDFFDSVGIDLAIFKSKKIHRTEYMMGVYDVYLNSSIHSPWQSLTEARTEAIKKANEIYNN